MDSIRLPRFQRSSQIQPIRLTARDRAILENVQRHRFLRSNHLIALVGGSPQQVLRRLHRLFHHGYLDRPRSQIDYYRTGSQAMVYGIGHKGAKFLDPNAALSRRPVEWTAKNRTATRLFIEHTLAVADVMVSFELACRHDDDLELVWHSDELVKWTVEVRHAGTLHCIGVVPDRVFGLRHRSQPADVAWYFLEADRATMPVERQSLKQTSFARKLLAYYETWRQGVIKHSFPRFRVLTVTTTPERMRHLIEAHQLVNHGNGAGLLLFTHHGAFKAQSNLLALEWLDGHETAAMLGTCSL